MAEHTADPIVHVIEDSWAISVIETLTDGPLGDHVRQSLIDEIVEELEGKGHDNDREWADSVIEWLRDNYEW